MLLEAKVNQKVPVYIGIDPGVETGFAFWCKSDDILILSTLPIHKAMEKVKSYSCAGDCLARFEDARLRKWFGNSGREKLQGAGSVKRDCKIWEDFLNDCNIKFEKVSPKQKGEKVSSDYFKKLTGYKKVTSQHARDAAMLVYGF